MDMKGIHNRIGGFGAAVARAFSSLAAKPMLAKAAGNLLRFCIGLLLPRGIIFGGWSPFALGFAASLGASDGALFGIVGSIIGYLGIIHMANGLKYIAICILIYTASFVFRGTALIKRPWFMPLSAVICTAAVGFVFVADDGFLTADLAFFVTELVLVAACSYFYQFYFNRNIEPDAKSRPGQAAFHAVSLLVLLSSLLIPLNNVTFLAQISLGRCLAVFFIMLAGFYGGIGVGSCAGVVFGLAIGVAAGTPAYCAIYGFSGVAAGIFHKKGKLIYTVVYLVSNAAAMLWITSGTDLPVLYEAFFASVFFLVAGEFLSERVPTLESMESAPSADNTERVRDFTRDRLQRAAQAFEELGDMLGGVLARTSRTNENNIAYVFDHPAQHICRKCELANACWEKDYISTKDALNSVTAAMREKGRLDASDLPLHFTSRCLKLQDFITEVNHELVAYQYRRQFRSRIAESRTMICKQYKEMSHVFDELSSEVGNEPHFDLRCEARIRRILSNDKLPGEVCVYRDAANHVHLQIQGANLTPLFKNAKQYLEQFSQALGVALTEPEKQVGSFGQRFLARQSEPLCASLGVAVHKKKDSDISGDSGSYFKLEDGRLCVILSDGMGTGKEAAEESASAIRMLERFLKSGIDPSTSLATINSALVIKSEELGGFATLDLMCLDLFNGETSFYKYGSAPTYIKRGRHIRRITSSALPAGISVSASSIDKTRLKLHHGDYVVLASDGVADVSDDAWLQTLISEYSGDSAKEFAAQIMNSAFSKYGRSDDMTVMVVRIGKN